MPAHSSRTSGGSAYIKRAIPYHATAITIIWVALLFLSLGFGMLLLVLTVRVMSTQQMMGNMLRQEIEIRQEIEQMKRELHASSVIRAPKDQSMQKDAESALSRGALSPDGKKYAGYDDVTPGKKGIGVRVSGETRVRHIEIFNARAELSGVGTPEGANMSVRWIDNQTIEYDVLVTQADGTRVQEARTTKIYF